ncbi:MAG: NlpC/P60 family protein [Flavobacteriaceae bacterium]
MKCFFSLACVFFLCLGCSNKAGQPDINNTVKSFLAKQHLDKRTTYIEVALEKNTVSGQVQSQQVLDSFALYLKKHNPEIKTFNLSVIVPQKAVVRNSVANARSLPKHSAELATQYIMGQTLNVIKQEGEWFLIQGPDNYIAWVDHGGVAIGDSISPKWINAPKAVVQANEGEGYSTENINTAATDLVFGNILGVLENRIYILPDGRTVRVNDSVFYKSTETNPVSRMLNRAHSLLGRPYLWGGTSTKAMDCSGFTRTTFLDANIMLGRDASLQVHEGLAVNKNNIGEWKPGDLLFFGNLRDDGTARISHVAIHIAEGKMIHASERVKIESLNPNHGNYNSERANTLLHVRRIL